MTERGLHIEGTLPLSRSDLEQLRDTFNTYDSINAFASEFGLEIPVAVHKPLVPTGAWLSECSTEEYGKLYADWVGYHNYLLSVQAHVAVTLHRLRTQYKQVELKLLQQNHAINNARTTKKMAKAAIEVSAQSDDTIVELSAQIAEYEQKKLLIDSAVTSADNTWRMLSRQVEIRKIDWESNNSSGSGARGAHQRPQYFTHRGQ